MKKILAATAAVLLLSGGAGYYYCAQQFDQQAQIFVATIDKAKTVLEFDSVEVDKYRFQIRFKNLKIDTMSLQNDQNRTEKGEPITYTMTNSLVLCYNPLTKNATFTILEHTFPFHLVQGKMDKQMTYSGEGDVKVSVSFKNHPNLGTDDLQKMITNMTDVSVHRPKTSVIDVETGKQLASIDPSFVDLKAYFPENDQEDVKVNLNYGLNNVTIDKELFETISQLVRGAMPGEEERRNAQSVFDNLVFYTHTTTEKGTAGFKVKMADLMQMINKTYDLNKGLPSLSGFLRSDNTSNLGAMKTDLDVNLDPKAFKIKVDMSGKFTPEIRGLYAAYLMNMPTFKGLSEGDALDIIPDLASLGNVRFALNVDGNLEKSEGKVDINLGADQYAIDAKANFGMATGGKIEAEFMNHGNLLADLKIYLDRIFAHKEIKAIMAPGEQENIMQGLAMAQLTLESMGKMEQKEGKTILKVEQELPGLGALAPAMGMPTAPIPEPAQ